MHKYHKIVWFEGMSLDPHHFQQWDRYSDSNLNIRFQTLLNNFWGLSELKIDKDALENGQLKLYKCDGIMPDGLVFLMPDKDPLPEYRSVSEHFSSTLESLGVFLAIPNEAPDKINCTINDNSQKARTRFYLEMIQVNDENTGANDRKIGVARSNFNICFETESREGMTSLKIAEIKRTADGKFKLNEEFIGPVLVLKASEKLSRILTRIFELIITKSSELRSRRRRMPNGLLDISQNDLQMYFLLNALNSWIPIVNHHVSTGYGHPENIYYLLQSLAGQLSTYGVGADPHPKDFPLYYHDNPAQGFSYIEKLIVDLLSDVTPPKKYVEIELEPKSKTVFVARINDEHMSKKWQPYLVCIAAIDQKTIENELVENLRVASRDQIKEVITFSKKALPISYEIQPPLNVPAEKDIHYIKLKKEGIFWEEIESSKVIYFSIPERFLIHKFHLTMVDIQ